MPDGVISKLDSLTIDTVINDIDDFDRSCGGLPVSRPVRRRAAMAKALARATRASIPPGIGGLRV